VTAAAAARLLALAFADRDDEALWGVAGDCCADAGDYAAEACLRWAVAVGLRPYYGRRWYRESWFRGSHQFARRFGDLPDPLRESLPDNPKEPSDWCKVYADGPAAWAALLAAWRPLYAAGWRPAPGRVFP
jgi:hypothetical protein